LTTPWLPDDVPSLERSIVDGARYWLGCCEEPLGSNTGPQVDQWNTAAGVPAKSYWCASFVAAVWKSCGAALPPYPASCDSWMSWAKQHGAWKATPSLGAAVLYGVPGDAKHIGIIVRVAPMVLSVEGNTTVEGAQFERNGTAVALKIVDAHDPVLGYVVPSLVAGPRVLT
jgi:hypothetical protein